MGFFFEISSKEILELPKDATFEQTQFKTWDVGNHIGSLPEVIRNIHFDWPDYRYAPGSSSSPKAAEILVKRVDKKPRIETAPEFAKKVEIRLQESSSIRRS